MADLWIPGWQRVDLGPDGGPFEDMRHPKGCVHTTEGTTLSGAESAYGRYPPHLGYDPVRRVKHQYVALNRHSYAFRSGETDDEYIIQVEVVGFAAKTHTWKTDMYSNFAKDVLEPLEDMVGIPRQHLRFYRADEGIVLARKTSPIRLRPAALRAFSGWLGHQHVPGVADNGAVLANGDDHWDPGGFLMDLALSFLQEEEEVSTEEIKRMMWAGGNVPGTVAPDTLVDDVNKMKRMLWEGGDVPGTTAPGTIADDLNKIRPRVEAMEAKLDAIMAHLGLNNGGPV
jgi:hypothetical protein